MADTLMVDMGGFRTTIEPDRYPNGRTCYVASHPDLPGLAAYHEDFNEACRLLTLARSAWLAHFFNPIGA